MTSGYRKKMNNCIPSHLERRENDGAHLNMDVNMVYVFPLRGLWVKCFSMKGRRMGICHAAHIPTFTATMPYPARRPSDALRYISANRAYECKMTLFITMGASVSILVSSASCAWNLYERGSVSLGMAHGAEIAKPSEGAALVQTACHS
jgi:hypothetical protein